MLKKFKHTVANWGDAFADPFDKMATLNLFRKAMYAFILFYIISSIPAAEELFSPDGLMPPNMPGPGIFGRLINILSYDGIGELHWLFIIMLILSCIAGLIGWQTKWMHGIIFITYTALLNRASYFNTSGHQLLVVLMVYYFFVSGKGDSENVIRNTMNRGVFWLSRLQIVLLYFVSVLFKLEGAEWMDGSALFYVLRIEQFNITWISDPILERPWMYMALTYFSFAYQVCFPVLVWFRKIKVPFLLLGVGLHLGIAFLMGLFDFGIIMILTYILFLPNEVNQKWLKKLGWQRSPAV